MSIKERYERLQLVPYQTQLPPKVLLVGGMVAMIMMVTANVASALPPLTTDCTWVNDLFPSVAPVLNKFTTFGKAVGVIILIVLGALLLVAGHTNRAKGLLKGIAYIAGGLILFGGFVGVILALAVGDCTGTPTPPPAAP